MASEAPGLLEELRRRKVVRVGLAYVMASWALLQVVDVVAPILEVTDATVQVLFWLLVAGFPVAVFLAWAFELTPEGIRSTERARAEYGEAQHEEAIQKRRNRLAYLSGIIGPAMLIGGGLGAAAVWTFVRPSSDLEAVEVSAETLPTIAVLPFTNMSPDENNAYFAAGVHEEILTRLSRLKNLRVISRTSVMRFDDTEDGIPEIAEMLGATHVVEGSVRREGNEVRVTAQLIEGRTDQHLWADNYDRTLDRIFEIQGQLATSIVAALETELTPREAALLGDDTPADIEAYELFTRARLIDQTVHFMAFERRLEAIELLNRAVSLDPELADAWQLLVRLEAERVHFNLDPDGNHLAAAEAALERAEALAPGDTDTLLARTYLLYHGKGRYEEALETVRRAREQEPGRSDLLLAESFILNRLMRWPEMIAVQQQAARLDPLNPRTHAVLARSLTWQERYQEAYEALLLRRAVAEPDTRTDFGVDIASVFASPDYAEWQSIMERRIDLLEPSDLPLAEADDNPAPEDLYLIMHLLTTQRFHTARDLLGMERETINRDFYRDVWQLKNEVRFHDYLEQTDEARTKAQELLEASSHLFEISEAGSGDAQGAMTWRSWAAGYLGMPDLAAQGLAYLEERLANTQDPHGRQFVIWSICEVLVTSDPVSAPACILDNRPRPFTLYRFATRLDLWHPVLSDPGIQAWLEEYPEWVRFMRDQWPDSRPFPFDQNLSTSWAR